MTNSVPSKTLNKKILEFISKQQIYGDVLNSISAYTGNEFMIENEKTANMVAEISKIIIKYEASPEESISALYQAVVGVIISKTVSDVINLAQEIIQEHQEQ